MYGNGWEEFELPDTEVRFKALGAGGCRGGGAPDGFLESSLLAGCPTSYGDRRLGRPHPVR
jgi:hypothetical protein